ncbi:MAG TPA: hypothetical protein VK034_03455 [Enhygromyxa sp.]|nr:hypothetical protein [Enhygromyxa sp.]
MDTRSFSNRCLALVLALGAACADPGSSGDEQAAACVGGQFCPEGLVCVEGFCEPASTDESGDGDGDPTTTGDGDPTTTGDGDGDPTTTGDGDGDGDPTTTGDGDGDPTTTGDGDGDPDPVCGDGVVNLDEECDDGGTEDGDGCSAICTLEHRLVFVTSQLYNGNFGGLAGADAKCQERADAAGLPGTYLAWLSTLAESPSSRFSHSTLPYVTVTGTVIADDWADLIDGTLHEPISITELGTTFDTQTNCGTGYAWSVTTTAGLLAGNGNHTCSDWTSWEGTSIYGNTTATSSAWTWGCTGGSCANGAALYCFMQ